MSFLDAAVIVLRASGRSMTAKELVDVAMSRGLITTRGATPDATLAAQLYVQLRLQPDGPLRRTAEPGRLRAQRGSVRWEWRE